MKVRFTAASVAGSYSSRAGTLEEEEEKEEEEKEEEEEGEGEEGGAGAIDEDWVGLGLEFLGRAWLD